MPAFELKILGGFELLGEDGKAVPIRSRKVRALLAYLALAPDRPHEREVLAGLLWADRFESQARQSLRQAILSLRNRLGVGASSILISDGSTLTCDGAAVRVDAAVFERLAGEANLEAAAAIYGGELLADLSVASEPFTAWLARERARLNECAGDCLVRLGMNLLDRGDGAAAISIARRAVELDAMSEPAHRLAMSAYAAAGRHVEALHLYQSFSGMLKGELGTEPDDETIRLFEAIRDGGHFPVIELSPADSISSPARHAGLDRPSIAVLPFVNLSGDQSRDYFADGITEDIITALSKSRMFFVTSRGSTMGYKDAGLNVKQTAGELGVRYVVEGSVRIAGERMRITTQLIDAETDSHVWAERHDGDMRDVFTIQDGITDRIVAAIAPEYISAEIHRVHRKESRNYDAWDHFVRAYWHLSQITKSDVFECRRLCREAIKFDPNGAKPYSIISITHLFDAIYDWGQSWEQSLHEGRDAALQGMALDDRDPMVLRCLAIVDFWSKRHDDAIHAIRRAIEIDPLEAENHGQLGHFLGMSGDFENAWWHFDHAVELSPRDVFMATWYSHFSMVAMAERRPEKAVELARIGIRLNPRFPGCHRSLAAALGHLDELDEARAALDVLDGLLPDLSIAKLRERLPFKHLADLEHYLDGMRKAGLAEQ